MAKPRENGRILEQVLAASVQVARLAEYATDVMYRSRRLQLLSRAAIEEAQRWHPPPAKERFDTALPMFPPE